MPYEGKVVKGKRGWVSHVGASISKSFYLMIGYMEVSLENSSSVRITCKMATVFFCSAFMFLVKYPQYYSTKILIVAMSIGFSFRKNLGIDGLKEQIIYFSLCLSLKYKCNQYI